jgi:hypothetical protein
LPKYPFELQKQDAPSIYSQNSPLNHRYCRQIAHAFTMIRQNLPDITSLRLVQQGFRGGKTPRKAIICSMNGAYVPRVGNVFLQLAMT